MEDVFADDEEEDEPERMSVERDTGNNSAERTQLLRRHEAQMQAVDDACEIFIQSINKDRQ